MIQINPRVEIDERELEWEFIRASGPGGQNVNKVSTAVRLRWRVVGSDTLPADVRERLIRLAGRRIGDDGFLTIHARSARTQEGNRREAIERLIELVQQACEKPKPRKATKPTAASRHRRLEAKKRRGQTKDIRRGPNHGDE
jgi:ribosome-associated protein